MIINQCPSQTLHISLDVSYSLGISFKMKVILVRKDYDKEILSNLNQETILKLYTLKCPSLSRN